MQLYVCMHAHACMVGMCVLQGMVKGSLFAKVTPEQSSVGSNGGSQVADGKRTLKVERTLNKRSEAIESLAGLETSKVNSVKM